MADTTLSTRFSIPKLNERNYAIWAMLVENAAHSVMGHDILTKKTAIPAVPRPKSDPADAEHYKTFYSLLTMLMTSISENCLYIVRSNCDTPYDVWMTLREHFRPSTNRNVIRLRGNFYRMTLQASGSMAKYIDGINEQAATINQLLEEIHAKSSNSSGSSPPLITNMEKLTVLLYGLGDDFATTREILENSQDISYEYACLRLKEKAEYHSLSSSSSKANSGPNGRVDHANTVNASQKSKRPRNCSHCRGRHASDKCWNKYPHLKPNFGPNGASPAQASQARSGNAPNSSTSSSSAGHQPQAPRSVQPTMPNRGHGNAQPGRAQIASEAWVLEEHFGVTISALHASNLNDSLSLIVDSGASVHILGAEFFPYLINWREGPIRRIRVADARICESCFVADLPFTIDTLSGPKNVTLTDCIYMEEFPRGLISVAKLSQRGIVTTFTGTKCIIQSKSMHVEVTKSDVNDLYLLNTSLPRENDYQQVDEASPSTEISNIGDSPVDPAVITTSQRKLYDLHSSLGHCSLKTLRSAVANGHIAGITLADLSRTLENCEICKTAKLRAHTTNNLFSGYPATQPFEKIHGDYGGKYRPTWNGKTGFSMYIDEMTSWISGRLVENKDEVRDHFESLLDEARLFGFQIQAFHTDSAKECFEKKTFIEFLTKNDIHRTASAPYAQYQNGLAEVTMQQLQNHIRCALYQSGLPHSYWGNAFEHTIFTWNRTPKLTNSGVTPYEMVTERIPDVRFMHPFGCQASAKHHNDDLPKFAPRGRPCIFLGYDTIRKAYKLLCLDDLSIIVRAPRDVTFNDHVFPVAESKKQNSLNSLFNDVEKDPNPNPHHDYVDFFIPNPPSAHSGGATVAAPQAAAPSTPPILLQTAPSPTTPALSLPNTPPTPALILPDAHFEGESTQIEQNSPPFDRRPLDLQRVWGSTPTFFRQIPFDLPRLRDRSSQAKPAIEIFDEVLLTEVDIHVQIDYATAISEVNSVDAVIPKSFAQAMSLPEREKWLEACVKEITAIIDSKTYVLIPPDQVPPGVKVATPIWSFRIKFDGTFKARLCFPGHRQQYGIDYFETESPVARFATFRIFMVIVTTLGEKAFHFDIPNAFLNGNINETVFMKQPPGFLDEQYPDYVCSLKKALYGLRQASLAWYIRLDDVLTSIGLKKHYADPCLYYFFENDEWALVLIYVDDNAIAGSEAIRTKIINLLKKEFCAKDLGIVSRYIGTSIDYQENGVFMHQKKDIEEFLKKQNYYNATPLKTPFNEFSFAEIANSEPIDETVYRSAIGSLMWYALSTRPDILFVVTSLAQFQAKPTKRAFDCIHKVCRYLRGTLDLGMLIPYPKGDVPPRFVLTPYSDASYSLPILDSRSASGIIFLLNGVPIHWISRKQRLITLSSTEAEIIASSLCAQELLWIMQILEPIVQVENPIEMCIDNLSMKYIAESVLTSHRTKHLNIRYLFVKQLLNDHPVVLKWVPTEENVADLFTKYFTTVGVFKALTSRITNGSIH